MLSSSGQLAWCRHACAVCVYIQRARQNGHHVADDEKSYFCLDSTHISQVFNYLIDNKPAIFRIMAWCQIDD